jgi:hypothetical protein
LKYFYIFIVYVSDVKVNARNHTINDQTVSFPTLANEYHKQCHGLNAQEMRAAMGSAD